ncbi:MAG: dTDP-glucose 4,6-dehydratase [Candidatus Omnitrophica bacterium]|nr:dTDP-glucose 4,6-dehydratase [Candidatus Omnitrophota bacterium]
MRLLVTGGAGFIGSQFVRHWLTRHPDDAVVTLDLLTYAGLRSRLEEIGGDPRHRFVQGDICEVSTVKRAMEGCEAVVHFAAETHVDRSITNAAPFLRTNVEGTRVLLQAAMELGVRRFLHVSTDEVYGPILEGSPTEDARLNPRSPYAASKAAGDLLVQAFWATYGLPTVVVRPTNVFGPSQFPEKFIPLSITNALRDAPLPIYGDGQQRRAWLFIEDLCRAIELIIQRGEVGSIYNVGSGSEFPNLEVARAILRVLGKPESLLRRVEDRPGHDRRYALDDRRLRALGWAPQVSFEDGLQRTIEWYRGQPAWWQPLKDRLHDDPYHWLNRAAGASPGQTARVER